MARIRSIKPEFFTSEDIVGLSPLARLLYIAVWCEADREGRLAWKPKTLKMRYLPADNCDIEALCSELVAAGLVRLYGDGFAVIPRFTAHQHVNPRETASVLPDPNAMPTQEARVIDASPTRAAPANDATVTHREEGKGKEGKEKEHASTTRADGSRLPEAWSLPEDWRAWALKERSDLDPDATAARFADHWRSQPGAKGRKADWYATWRNWVRGERTQVGRGTFVANGSRRPSLDCEEQVG